ncbi:MAG: GAF domain-containing protein [Planctomycetes bacterium]|nr:GAF domain-containing protein [Planctomycetota bacterium]
MNNEQVTINPEKAVNELRNILNSSRGTVLDDALSKELEEALLHMEQALFKQNAGIKNVFEPLKQDNEILNDRRMKDRRKNDNIMDVIGAGLSLLDQDLKIVWANSTVIDWFNLAESPIGSSCHNVYHCNEAGSGVCPAAMVFEGRTGHKIEACITTRDNKRLFVQHVAIPITGRDREINNVLMMTVDVTVSERLLHWLLLLRQLGEKMQGTLNLDNLLHMVLTCVTTGYAFGFNRAMLFLVNKKENSIRGELAVGPSTREEAARIWGEIAMKNNSLEEVLDALEHDSDFDETLSILTRQMKYMLTDTKEVIVTCTIEKKPIIVTDAANDTRLTEEFKNALGVNAFVCVPMIVSNESIGVIVADNLYTDVPITDDLVNVLTMFANQAALAIENAETCKRLEDKVTQLTSTQQRLIQSEKHAAIGSMAAYIAHEIRNPLVTIGGFARSLSRFHFEDTKIKTNLDIILDEVIRLELILNNITSFSKPGDTEKVNVQISEIMGNTCTLMEHYLQEKHINMFMEFGANLPHISVAPSEISQVFLNVLKNAAESMPEGGDLTIKIRTDNQFIVVDITDTGKGMSQEEVQKIFDPFYTTKQGGTGVGLAVCFKIIENHGGKVLVESECGKGTTMSLLFPI